jgi:hypothetical protein
MVLMLVAYSLPNFHQHNRRIKFLFVGLFASYLVLHLWYQVFSYKFFSRFDYVLTNGFEFFLKRYDQSVIAFWLTPGIGFLLIYASLMIYFLFLKKYIFSLSAVISVMAAYAALFFTTDGVRIFSLAIAPSYSLMLRYGIVNAFDQYNNQTTPKTKAKITAFSLKAGLIIFWCTVIIYAQGFGLIINVWPQQLKSEQAAVLFNYFIALLGIIVFAISLGARKKDPWLLHYLLKLLLFTPLIAIVLQVSRLALIPDYSLNLFQKSILVGLIMIVADQLSRAPMDALVRNVAFKYRQFSIWYRTL